MHAPENVKKTKIAQGRDPVLSRHDGIRGILHAF